MRSWICSIYCDEFDRGCRVIGEQNGGGFCSDGVDGLAGEHGDAGRRCVIVRLSQGFHVLTL